jgi:hypothetical protein
VAESLAAAMTFLLLGAYMVSRWSVTIVYWEWHVLNMTLVSFQVDGSSIDVGVTQRIDGSDSEKQAIREVLKRMDYYFFNEVLAMPEYEYVRPRW